MTAVQTFQIAFEAWGALFCLIAAAAAFSTRSYDRKGARSLIALLLTAAVLNGADALAYYFRGNTTALGYYMVRIPNFAVFACNYLLMLFFLLYLCRVIERCGGNEHPLLRNLAIGFILGGLAQLILSRIFGFYYAFDAQNRYYRLGSYWIMLASAEVPLLFIAHLIFTNWKHLKSIEKSAFREFIFLPILGIVLQMFIYGVSITTVASTVAILTVFLSFELEYSDFLVQKERKLLDQMIAAFAETIDAKDPYTGGHSGRVAKYARMLAQRMGLSKEKVRRVYQTALLHDVGKIGVDETILRKPEKLSASEFGQVKGHSARGSSILSNITEMPELAAGARWHHERYDGKGYPDGLKGRDIPLEARIISVADSYDAMTSDRPYRSYLPQQRVREEIERNAGTQFDPRIAKCMLDIIDEDPDYRLHE